MRPRGRIGSRLQGGLCRGRCRREGSRRLAQSMDHDRIDTGGGEERPPTPANFDQAVALSKEAEALAKASIFQATSEKDAWKAHGDPLNQARGRGQFRDANPPPGFSEGRGRCRRLRAPAAARARGRQPAASTIIERFGNARILHITDTHAQLQPVYFREPSVNLGIGEMQGRPPHLVGRAFLDHFGIRSGQRRRLCLHQSRFREVRGPLRQARRLRTSEDADRSPAQRRRRLSDRCCSTAAISGRAAGSPMPCRAPTWSRRRTCSASRR